MSIIILFWLHGYWPMNSMKAILIILRFLILIALSYVNHNFILSNMFVLSWSISHIFNCSYTEVLLIFSFFSYPTFSSDHSHCCYVNFLYICPHECPIFWSTKYGKSHFSFLFFIRRGTCGPWLQKLLQVQPPTMLFI